jgi:hypothetical protein
MAKAATFGPQTARDIIAVVQYLQRNGFAITPPGRGDNRIPEADYVFVRNDTGEEIPPYACLQVTGSVEYNGQNWLTVEKPVDTDGTAGWFVFNGFNAIGTLEPERYGTAHDGPHVRMLTDGSTVTAGNRWRPTVGAFTIEPGDGPFIAGGEDDIKPDVMKGFIVGSGGSGGGTIEYTIDSIRVATSAGADAPYTGLTIATVTVVAAPCNQTALIGTEIDVVDHSQCIFDLDEEDLIGVHGWASEKVALSLDPEAEIGELTPCHWSADNRCCAAGS